MQTMNLHFKNGSWRFFGCAITYKLSFFSDGQDHSHKTCFGPLWLRRF